ncbi:MAG: DNA-binding protein WhiA [Peptoniphilaceae bacterium]|nr:DNA-binding protein WhiA [Peptoniphilaceae bacterium]MDD7382876.1 DNA-binding protein WhiA [Peptoniphilaceae bacterium]MDY3738165.1 DNA-binding protein WhiA [Peptoniphilaceae bacterium]
MSFSQRTKKDISLEKINENQYAYELSSYVKLSGYIRIFQQKLYTVFDVDNNIQAKRIYNIIKKIYDFSPTIEIKNNNKFTKNKIYRVLVDDETTTEKILKNEEKLGENIYDFYDKMNEDDLKTFLKVSFLLNGSITDPKRGYYVEFVFESKEISDVVFKIMDNFNLQPKKFIRKKNYIIYLKDSDEISDFLSLISAYKALLELQNVKAMKELRNNINRQTNCDKANIDRTVNASLKQISAIEKLKKNDLFKNLPDELKNVAEIRIENPYISIEDLGKLTNPTMSKAKINYRLQKLIKLSEEI